VAIHRRRIIDAVAAEVFVGKKAELKKKGIKVVDKTK
jgi:hypothetical protein